MSALRRLFRAGIITLLPLTSFAAVDDAVSVVNGIADVAPLQSVKDFAAANRIPLEGIAIGNGGEEPHPGDQVVILVTFFEGERYRQWLVSLKTESLTESERQKKAPNDIVHYTITGETLRYPSTWSALGVRIAGPYRDMPSTNYFAASPADKSSRMLVRSAFLGLGFDRACQLVLRIRPKLKVRSPDSTGTIDPAKVLNWSNKPFSAAQIETGRRLAAEIGMTPEDEQLIGGVSPALAAFLRIGAKAPGLQEIMLQVLEIPSLWSILRQGGLACTMDVQSASVGPVRGDGWKVNLPVYRLPFVLRINGRAALECALDVVEPRRPLLTCAGVLGFSALDPDNNQKRLDIRVVATRLANR